ncbi:MAG TPA: M28 family peptidase [Chitinophagaceae bacterium]|nr:M28 family peptidase [Chitinophagaceae bacterium]
MNKLFAVGLLLVTAIACEAQVSNDIINPAEAERIERILSSDEMQGRRTFTPGIDKAAAFIADEFKKAGLQTWPGLSGYLQTFNMVRPNFVSAKANFDGTEVDGRNIIVFTTKPTVTLNEKSGYEVVRIAATDTFNNKAFGPIRGNKNVLVLVDPAHDRAFRGLTRFKRETSPTERIVVFVLSDKTPTAFSIEAEHKITDMPLSNVVGVIPGKSKKDEYVIFSAHYDHLGIGRPNKEMDSIFNGANDDASGTTAVILLANYFKKLANNERTLVFVAFTAEESGGFGSQYFSKQMDPAKVMAMFNIEMIGTESKWGTNSAFITGYERTDMGKILEKNLQGSQFKFYPDPYPDQQLFFRSDNATLARLGVPAHTISTSKMDSEKFYHTQDDEIETLDMKNMAEIIKAIAISSTSIVAGKDSPSRVDVKTLAR